MTTLLASNNAHKYNEMTGILRHAAPSVTLLRPVDVGFRFDAEEPGHTFSENAMIKARAAWLLQQGIAAPGVTVEPDVGFVAAAIAKRFGAALPVLADDSGISVDALDGAPGVTSARFGSETLGPEATDADRTALLLETLANRDDRGAHYTCNAVLIVAGDRYFQAQETWAGEVARELHPGQSGFGYDPLFWLPSFGCSVSQLPQEQKDRISHRALAVAAVMRAASVA